MPVDKITGFPNLITSLIKGRSVNSPEPILNQLTPISFNSHAALNENGVHK